MQISVTCPSILVELPLRREIAQMFLLLDLFKLALISIDCITIQANYNFIKLLYSFKYSKHLQLTRSCIEWNLNVISLHVIFILNVVLNIF